MPQNRNILFIVIDQLRADCLTGALSEHVDLPNLRRFMKEAVTFKNTTPLPALAVPRAPLF